VIRPLINQVNSGWRPSQGQIDALKAFCHLLAPTPPESASVGHLDNEDLGSLYSMVKELMKRGKARAERSSLMNVGRRVDYAVRALSYLAGQPAGKVMSRSDIEQSQGIPSFYLSKIMKDLVTGGLVVSHVGSKGGFTLAKPPPEISIKDVYECVERPLVLMECLEQGVSYCSFCSVCRQKSVWEQAQEILANFLSGVFISDIADRQGLKGRLAKMPMRKAV
jgi:Rrf2 family protein